MQTNVQGKEKEGNATKCCISPHFSTDLKFCLHQGWSVEKAVQHLWKCASTECWKAHSTTFLSWLHIISIRLIAIRSFGSCYLRTRFVRCTCIQGTKMQTNVQDKEKEGNATKCCISPQFYIELKFCLHQGWSVEKAVQHLWKCASKECWKTHSTTFLSRLHIISIRLIAIRRFENC